MWWKWQKKVEDLYSTKDEYSKLFCEYKGKLNNFFDKHRSNLGEGGSSEPKSKIWKLANQKKKYIFIIKYLKENPIKSNGGSNS